MVPHLRAAIAFAAALATLGAASAGIPIRPDGTLVTWQGRSASDSAAYLVGDLRLTLGSARTRGGWFSPVLEIYRRGQRQFRVVKPEDAPIANAQLAVARFDAGAEGPGVLFSSWTGGAHCCRDVQVAEKVGGVWRAVEVGAFDMDLPKRFIDVDGDGVADIVLIDDDFDYAFASFAGSYRVPAIYNIRNGLVWNVSAEPKYRGLYEEELKGSQAACVSDPSDHEVNGACAAFVADAARLGLVDWAWPIMLAHYDRSSRDWPDGCRNPSLARCPKDQRVEYPDFPTALRAFLERYGYIRAPGAPVDRRGR